MDSRRLGYSFDNKYRGQAVIIVNKNFKSSDGKTMKPRNGATKDLKKMCTMFADLDFKVKPYWDLKASEMKEKVKKACEAEENRNSDCFVLVISTHGGETYDPKKNPGDAQVYEHEVQGSDNVPVNVEELMKLLEHDTLSGKPKLCFFQACRTSAHKIGKNPDTAVDVGVPMDVAVVRGPDDKQRDKEPDMKDGTEQEDMADCSGIATNDIYQDWETQSDDNSFDPFTLPDSDSESDEDMADAKPRGFPVPSAGGSGDANPSPPLPPLPPLNSETTPGTGEETPLPPLPGAEPRSSSKPVTDQKPLVSKFDVVPVHCPTDVLIMYPVQPHKLAFRSKAGSWMLTYMFNNRLALQTGEMNLLQYLTTVSYHIAQRDSDFKFKGQTVDRKLKMAATLVHRLTDVVAFKPKGEKSTMAKSLQSLKMNGIIQLKTF